MYRNYPLSFDKPYKQTADNRSMFPYMSRSFFALFFCFLCRFSPCFLCGYSGIRFRAGHDLFIVRGTYE